MTEERKKEFDNLCLTFESGIVANFQLALIMAQNYKEEFEAKYEVCYEDLVKAADYYSDKYRFFGNVELFKDIIQKNTKNVLRRMILEMLQTKIESNVIADISQAFSLFEKYKDYFLNLFSTKYENANYLLGYFGENIHETESAGDHYKMVLKGDKPFSRLLSILKSKYLSSACNPIKVPDFKHTYENEYKRKFGALPF